MSTTTARIGQCAECGRDELRIRANGTVWNHGDKRVKTGMPFPKICDGSGKRPQDGSVRDLV